MRTLASSVRSGLLTDSEVGPPRKFSRESVLFQQDHESIGLFLLESGLAKLTRKSATGRQLIFSVIGSHQVAGEESLAQTPSRYLADLVCLTEVTGYYIPLDVMNRLLVVPDFASAFLSYAIFRDQERINRIEMLAWYDVERRILHVLAELARLVEPNADGTTYSIPMTQAEIASFIGATRETTSTTLSILQARGLVALGRRMITTADPATLMNAASNGLAKRTTV